MKDNPETEIQVRDLHGDIFRGRSNKGAWEGHGVSSSYMARIHDYLKFLSTIHHVMCR